MSLSSLIYKEYKVSRILLNIFLTRRLWFKLHFMIGRAVHLGLSFEFSNKLENKGIWCFVKSKKNMCVIPLVSVSQRFCPVPRWEWESTEKNSSWIQSAVLPALLLPLLTAPLLSQATKISLLGKSLESWQLLSFSQCPWQTLVGCLNQMPLWFWLHAVDCWI